MATSGDVFWGITVGENGVPGIQCVEDAGYFCIASHSVTQFPLQSREKGWFYQIKGELGVLEKNHGNFQKFILHKHEEG